uniref:Uncharacterized protein n=1 Tax=Arundo donax TaxID=35708 RepID=A0A0A9B5B2_ARUDO
MHVCVCVCSQFHVCAHMYHHRVRDISINLRSRRICS